MAATSAQREAVERLLTAQQLTGQLVRDVLLGAERADPSPRATLNALAAIRAQLDRAEAALQ